MKRYSLSFVIPVYNSEKTIEKVVDRIKSASSQSNLVDDIEIILVNDNSRDSSWNVIKNISQQNPNVIAVNLSRNFGQANAIMAGIGYVNKDFLICMDDDLQMNPEDYLILLDKLLNNNLDAVYANYGNKKHALWRNIGTIINNQMSHIFAGRPKHTKSSSFFVARKFVVDEMKKYTGLYPYMPGLVFRITQNISNCLVSHNSREHGRTGYTLSKLLKLWLNGFTTFSILPLRFAVFSGFFFSCAAFLWAIILVIIKIVNQNIVLGWTSTIVVILFLSGIQLTCVGLLGEYIGRIYINQNKSPQYVIREVSRMSDEDENEGENK